MEKQNNDKMPSMSEVIASRFNRLMQWMKPNPEDHMALTVVKTFFKSLVMLLLLLISPVLLIGLAAAFIGPM